jgi:putrescine---pyruvate transaminase
MSDPSGFIAQKVPALLMNAPLSPEITKAALESIRAKDADHYLHPFTDFKALAREGSRIIVRGEGVYIYDASGQRILDGMSGLWNVALGYGRQELADAAYRQMMTLPFYNSFFQTSNIPAAELAATLADIAPANMRRVFYSNSGSEANDTIVRATRRYWELVGEPKRDIIISRNNGYHGSTMAGASLGGMSGMHAQGGLPIPGIEHIEQPYYYQHGRGLTSEAFGIKAAGWLENKILALGPERVAAFIGEPVQGAGGVIIPPATYWPEIQRICDKYGVLLISDEVICGFGRLGQWFGCQHFGVRPDFIAFAKAVTSGYFPLGGVIVSDRVSDVLIEKGGEFNHGYTNSGHPVGCALALENIRVLRDEGIIENVRSSLGPYLATQFNALADHPLVAITETLGMVAGLVLAKNKVTREPFDGALEVGMICRRHCFESGVVMRAVGDRMIIAPPLVISRAEIDQMIGLIRRSLDLTLQELARKGNF